MFNAPNILHNNIDTFLRFHNFGGYAKVLYCYCERTYP